MLKSEKYFMEMKPDYWVEIEALVKLGGMIERLAPCGLLSQRHQKRLRTNFK
jgi:hypothetical protein